MKHTISVLMRNEPGVLSRVCDLFSGRGYGIDSLSVAVSLDQSFSRATIVTTGDNKEIEQIIKQLNRLIPVLKVLEVGQDETLIREFLLCKIRTNQKTRSELLRIADIFKAQILDVTDKASIVQMSGTEKEISSFLEFVKPLGIKEMARSGKVALCPDTSLEANKEKIR